jgi:hypothetical protein
MMTDDTKARTTLPAPLEWRPGPSDQICVDDGGTVLAQLWFDPDWGADARAVNLRHICQAVNSFEAMRDALKEADDVLETLRLGEPDLVTSALAKVRSAIALAEGWP